MATREQFLQQLWRDLINVHLRQNALETLIKACERDPDGPFGDAGAAVKRMLDAGASKRDVALFARAIAYEAIFGVLYALDDPGIDGDHILMLHESLLSADPSGLEGRPGSADVG